MNRARVVFFGSPDFAVPTLRALIAAENVVAVVTQPDKPAGRGQRLAPPAAKTVAMEAGVPVLQPRSVRGESFAATLAGLAPDVAIVVAFGRILPQAVLDVPVHGCLNVHASLLPRYRGAAPIQWAIADGETETGITIMKLDAGMDTGPVLLARRAAINEDDTAGTLSERLARMGAELMLIAWERLRAGTLVETPQDDSLATSAPMLTKAHGLVDWSRPAVVVRNLVRSVDPWPGAFTSVDDETLKIWGPRVVPGQGKPGEVLGVDSDGLVVACGTGAVMIRELQLPGRKRLPAKALIAGRSILPGTLLGAQ
ncbi:MAG: methionyl-tRNA formyltransferase [Pseudomonadota bacterium]